MPYHRGVARDVLGNAISGASVNVYEEGTTTAASIFSDAALASTLSNPITTDTDGEYEFWVASGIYDILITAAGFSNVSIPDVQIGQLGAAAYVSSASTVALNTSTFVQLAGTWAATIAATNAWTVATDGGFTWNGDKKVFVKVTYSGSTVYNNSATDGQVIFAVGIDGTYDTTTDIVVSRQDLNNDPTEIIHLSWVLEVESGEEITIGAKDVGGTPTLGSNNGSQIIVEVIA